MNVPFLAYFLSKPFGFFELTNLVNSPDICSSCAKRYKFLVDRARKRSGVNLFQLPDVRSHLVKNLVLKINTTFNEKLDSLRCKYHPQTTFTHRFHRLNFKIYVKQAKFNGA